MIFCVFSFANIKAYSIFALNETPHYNFTDSHQLRSYKADAQTHPARHGNNNTKPRQQPWPAVMPLTMQRIMI